MAERQPGFTLYRPVIGINDERLHRLKRHLGTTRLFDKADIRAVFGPASRMQAGILWERELNRLPQHIGHEFTKREARDLAAFVQEGLPLTSGETLHVPLLPGVLHPEVLTYKKSLVVATSEVVKVERVLAKNAVRTFFGMDEVPEGVWYDDDYAAGVHLAHSRDEPRFKVIRHLDELLAKHESPLLEGGILPSEVQLGPIEPPRFNFES